SVRSDGGSAFWAGRVWGVIHDIEADLGKVRGSKAISNRSALPGRCRISTRVPAARSIHL
ncbi:hypothetical protein OAH22_02270, partial [bacterium]|nr:hypothetical protein [bacterium]